MGMKYLIYLLALLIAVKFIFLQLFRLALGFIKDSLTPKKHIHIPISNNNETVIICEMTEFKLRDILENKYKQGTIISLSGHSSNLIVTQKSYPHYIRLKDRILNWDKKIYVIKYAPKY